MAVCRDATEVHFLHGSAFTLHAAFTLHKFYDRPCACNICGGLQMVTACPYIHLYSPFRLTCGRSAKCQSSLCYPAFRTSVIGMSSNEHKMEEPLADMSKYHDVMRGGVGPLAFAAGARFCPRKGKHRPGINMPAIRQLLSPAAGASNAHQASLLISS